MNKSSSHNALTQRLIPLVLNALLAGALNVAGDALATTPQPISPLAADWTQAREQAEATGKDIAVLLYGREWSRAGAGIKDTLWDAPEFARAVGDAMILLAIEHNESQPGESENQELRAWSMGRSLDERSPSTLNIVSARDDAGNLLKAMADGSVLATNTPPAKAVYTLEVERPATHPKALAMIFLADESFPGNKAGRATNGNFVINEIEVMAIENGQEIPVPIAAAWADFIYSAKESVDRAIDGKVEPAHYWNAGTHRRAEPIQMILVPAAPLPEGERLQLRIHAISQHARHLPGRMRIETIDDAETADFARTWFTGMRDQAELADRNAGLPCSTGNYPALFLVDSEQRIVASRHGLSLADTREELVAWLREKQELRRTRDALLKQAESASGPEKADILARGVEIMAMGLGPKNIYQPILDAITAADPGDLSHRVRQFTLNPGAIEKEAARLAQDDTEEKAIAYLNRELNHPGNVYLTVAQLQSLHWTAYGFYKGRKNHEGMVEAWRQVGRIDPTTSLGYACASKYLMQADVPSLRFGWNTIHTATLPTTWTIGGELEPLLQYFPHAGAYAIELRWLGGDAITVTGAVLKNGDKALSVASGQLPFTLAKANPIGTFSFEIAVQTAWDDVKLEVAIQGEKPSSGTFAVKAVTEPPPADPPSGLGIESLVRVKQTLRTSLLERTRGGRETLQKLIMDKAYQKELTIHEVLRLAGTTNLQSVIETQSGARFLKHFLADADWMASWLYGSHTKEPAIELKRIAEILQHDPGAATDPLLQRLATTIGLARDSLEKYDYFKESHERGRLHSSFYEMPPEIMRLTLGISPADGRYLRDIVNRPFQAYGNIHYMAPYRLHNIFGDSIHGPHFHRPWAGLPRMQQIHWGAGVCGSLTTLGEMVFKSHGIPSHGFGEPGHRAYRVRRPNGRWMKLYSLSSATHNRVQDANERVWQAMDAVRDASLHLWQARLLAEALSDAEGEAQKVLQADLAEAYALARKAHPIWPAVWHESIAAMKTTSPSVEEWSRFTRGLVPAMAPQGADAAYAIWRDYQGDMVAGLDAEAMLRVHLAVQEVFLKQHPTRFIAFHDMLKLQTTHFGKDDQAILAFYKAVAEQHAVDEHCQSVLLLWGVDLANRFPSHLETITAQLISTLALQNPETNARTKHDALSRLMTVARDKKQFAMYHQIAQLSEELLSLDDPKERHLNAKQLASAPNWEPFPGELLSPGAILQPHSAHGSDRILMHPRVLDERGGFIWANPHKDAWVQMEFPEPVVLSGVIVVNRFEDQKNLENQSPLRIMVSNDGRSFTEVYSSTEAKAVWRADLSENPPAARFVRVATQREKGAHFQLRNILVYGNRKE